MSWMKFRNALVGNTQTDRKIKKFLYGVEELPKLPLRGKITKFVLTLLLMGIWSLMLVAFTWFAATGSLPFGPQPVSIVPPDMQSTVTAAEAEQAVENSTLDLPSYGVGTNCVEIAFLAARELWWAGYPATVVKIDFSDGTGHILVGIPTVDDGWKFLEPQDSSWVSPVTGGFFMNKQISGLSYLYDFVWKPIEVEK